MDKKSILMQIETQAVEAKNVLFQIPYLVRLGANAFKELTTMVDGSQNLDLIRVWTSVGPVYVELDATLDDDTIIVDSKKEF